MGRYISSSSSTSGSTLDTLKVPVGTQAILANQLVTMDESGRVRPTAQKKEKTVAQENNSNTAGPFAITSATLATGSFNPTHPQTWTQRIALLTNGNLVISWADSNPYQKFTIITPSNVVVKATSNVSTTHSSTYAPQVIALSTGGFVYLDGHSGQVYRTIYDNAGTVVSATASLISTVDSAQTHSNMTWYPVALDSGKFAVMYRKTTSLNICFQIFNSDGTSAVGETQIGTLVGHSSAYDLISAMKCTNGDIVFYHGRYSGGTGTNVARYTSGGVIVGSVQNISTAACVFMSGARCNNRQVLAELSDGSIAAVMQRSTGTYYDVAIINAAFTSKTTVALGNNALFAGHVPCLAASPDGTFGVLYGSDSVNFNYLTVYNNAGTVVVSEVDMGGISNDTTAYRSLFCIPYVGWAQLSQGNSSGTYTVKTSMVNLSGTALGSTIALGSGMSGGYPDAVMSLNGVLYMIWYSTYTYLAAYSFARSSILGVATEAKSAGASSVTVSTVGYYTLTGQTFDVTLLDNTAAAIPGPKGRVFGSAVLLKGMT